MVTEKVVFILGAGASRPYGFPTAVELRKDIIYNFPNLYKEAHAKYTSTPNNKISLINNYQGLIDTFKMSSTKSIDLFLARNTKFRELGKKIIAFLMGYYEQNSKFREDVGEPKYDWYMHLYDLLTKDISNTNDLNTFFDKNQVSFISFNYDRSLEQFLFESFFNSFLSKRNEISKLFSKMKIIHVYGKIAPLPFENNDYHFNYRNENYYDYLDDLANNIKIVYEEKKDDLIEAKQIISEAHRIFFLGFGYADENLAALDFSGLLNKSHRIYGTALGSTEIERRKIVTKLLGKNENVYADQIIIRDCDSVMLLRNHIG